MSGACNISHPLTREGTFQWQRFPAGLREGFFKPDNRQLEDLVKQVAEYAAFVKYTDVTGNEWGDWKAFFEYLYDYKNNKLKVDRIDSLLAGNTPPHLGLLLSFLKNFQVAQNELNAFTGRHLDFYYEKVLNLQPLPSVADTVALVMEPEKNTVQAKVPKDCETNAGKDKTGKALVYKTTREIIVNQVSLQQKKTIYASAAGNKLLALHGAKNASTENSFDKNGISSWYPFGSPGNEKAKIGFAITSPILYAKEGRRRVSIEITGGALLPRQTLTAFYTGPKGWVEAVVDTAPGPVSGNKTEASKYLLVKIDDALPAVTAYSEKIHQCNYSTTHPVIKILVKNDGNFDTAWDYLSSLQASALKKIRVNVEGAKSFTVFGESGKLNPLQPFKPFGNSPVKNKSFFTIGSSEIFNKYLRSFHVATNWKGAPGMKKHYSAYEQYLAEMEVRERLIQDGKPVTDSGIASELEANPPGIPFASQWNSFDQGNVPGRVELLSGGKWKKVEEDKGADYKTTRSSAYNLFHVKNVITDNYENIVTTEFTDEARWGFARVTLGYDFGHAIFPQVIAYTTGCNALAKSTSELKPVAPQPYTPEFNSLHLDYVLESNLSISATSDHRLLQVHPFGHAFIQSGNETLVTKDYEKQGQLYLGFANCSTPQIINLYIARLDGTEDIDSIINEDIAWYYLNGKQWIAFSAGDMVVNTTTGFTSSGFISFRIPQDALGANTIMGENLVWIKAVSASSAGAYPSIIDIHSNAVEAVFINNENDPLHLQAPLPAGTITKPVLKTEGIKKISQPYSSTGGKMAEQKQQFYTRVSERLRHKDRAWNLWDYERLILHSFPSIFKLKCINHSAPGSMYAPGKVLCVALPSVVNIAEKDLLKPRISKAVLTKAAEEIKKHMSPFAQVEVINPVYEEITVKCDVKIKSGYDESFYQTQLNADLQGFIAPWIINSELSPSFGGSLYASAIINFIEEREYVDYLTFFEATKTEEGKIITWTDEVSGSDETVILTSAAQHLIDTNAIC